MLDIKFVRSNPEVVKQNIKNKFQDSKLPLVDEVLELDQKNREIKGEVEALRAEKNKTSKQIGAMMAQGKKEEAEELKRKVTESADKMEALSAEEKEKQKRLDWWQKHEKSTEYKTVAFHSMYGIGFGGIFICKATGCSRGKPDVSGAGVGGDI